MPWQLMPLLAVRPQCWQRTGSSGGTGTLVFLVKLVVLSKLLSQQGLGESAILGGISFCHLIPRWRI